MANRKNQSTVKSNSSQAEKQYIRVQKELQAMQEAWNHPHSQMLTQLIYELVAQEHNAGKRFSVSKVLHLLNLSFSGYYDYLKREPSKQALHKEEMKKQIKQIYEESDHTYGAPRITKILNQQGIIISPRTVGRLYAGDGYSGL
ncbi:IS3 family transposase [Lactobacillus intestinalis]|uniref:IS3 family transposase n=1 Tax=Lactobacillus intestinalis TaxID=151781 RepID=UPI00266F0540|nr:IS3 family transposase [Lactobacillus intestinalis]